MKHILKLLQLFAVAMIPLSAVQYYLKMFDFAENYNNASINFFSNFTSTIINGIDCSLLFIIIPWVILIILSGSAVNFLEDLKSKTKQFITEYKSNKVTVAMEKQKQANLDELQKKTMVYMTVALGFSKFTISNLSENELLVKKSEIKERLFRDIETYRGKLIEDEQFEDDDTLAFAFFSQEDVLNFIFKFKEIVSFLDNDIQNYGYSLNYRIALDSQSPENSKHEILAFLEKVLKTVELYELCATNSFADRYKINGTMKHISFVSKGTYSINKTKVELNNIKY